MSVLSHPVFGKVNVDPDDGVEWTGARKLGALDVPVALDLPGGEPDVSKLLDKVAPFVTALAAHDEVARSALEEGYEDGPDSPVASYIEHHLDELDEKAIAKIFGSPKEEVDPPTFLRALHLGRVGLYPSELDRCAVFDYTIGKDATQYVLSVAFDVEGGVTSIDMES